MAWSIPDKGEGDNDLQSVLFQEQLEVFVAAGNPSPDGVLSGLAITGGADMTPAVAKGSVLSNGVLRAVAAADVTIGTAHATNPRLDLIVVDSSGALQVRAGTASATPKPPNRTANDVVLGMVYVPANDTTIATSQVVDMRAPIQLPAVIHRVTSAVTFNNTNTIQTYLSVTIPDGLFLTGRILRVRCGGNQLLNSGTTTVTLTIAYGGTTLFADTSAASTNDADRRPWFLEFDLVAVSSSSQVLVGQFQTAAIAGLTGPTTGTGDIWSTAMTAGHLRGTAAVNSDNANRTLTVQWTHSVANAAVETVMDYAVVELL